MSIQVTGGEKLKAFIEHYAQNKKLELEVGFFADATYPKNGVPVAAVAIINEFGTKDNGGRIPERPFFRNANAILKTNLQTFLVKHMVRVAGALTVTPSTLELLGLYHQGLIQKAIDNMTDPPNAPSTIRQKKSDHPLFDTGHMKQSVTYKVTTE
jgi:hypothetical protein